MSGKLILIGGGARSGKSAFALALARAAPGPRALIATAQAFDAEMAERIDKHRAERGPDFATIEEPLDLGAALERTQARAVVIDCLTLWLSNALHAGATDRDLSERLDALLAIIVTGSRWVALVTNEVGLGIVPDQPLARRFRDVSGRAHQRLAEVADEVYLGVLGTMLRLKPAPVEAVRP